jgi:hypothetical protein
MPGGDALERTVADGSPSVTVLAETVTVLRRTALDGAVGG